MEPSTEQQPPDVLVGGRYRLLRQLGRGGMAVVWQGRDEVLHRDVAVKEVLPPRDLSPGLRDEIRERTMREARAAARLTHPSVVTVFDVVEDGGRPWIVMELLPPRTLSDALAAGGPLTPDAAARLGEQLVSALQTAHAAGVLHRDVKPSNVMLADDGRVVLTDFGIATVEEDPSITATGMLIGSPGYMAPERARGERPTAASDLWSLGATLFTATEGSAPFQRDGQLATMNAVISLEAPPAAHAGPLRTLIARLLDRDPARRPAAEEAHEELRRIVAGMPGTMTVTAPDGADDQARAPGRATTQVIDTPPASTRRLPLDAAIPPGRPAHPEGAPPHPSAPYRQPAYGAPYGARTASLPAAGTGPAGRRGGGPLLLTAVLVIVAAAVLAFLLTRPGFGGTGSPAGTTPARVITSEPSAPPATTSAPESSPEPETASPSPTETPTPTSETDTPEETAEPSTSEASSSDTSSTEPGDGGDTGGDTGGGSTDGGGGDGGAGDGDGGGEGSPAPSG